MKMKEELSNLMEKGIVVEDREPAEWLSPIVIVDKPDGSVQICLDPKYLNSQLVRAQCHIPTTTEIFSRVNGSKYFSTVDARQSFHQIMLDEKSSRLTCFVTPFGKY